MRLALLLALLPLAALAEGSPPPAAPVEAGDVAPHLAAAGRIGGREVEIAPADAAAVTARRTYRPGHAGWRYAVLEVALTARIGGEPRTVVLRLTHDDLLQQPAPATFALTDLVEPEGLEAHLLILTAPADGTAREPVASAGWAGTLALERDEGSRDADMLLDGGVVSGRLSATRGEDHLALSFTAPVKATVKQE